MKRSPLPVVKPCRLCLQTKELQFSHIIPNLFFRKLKRDDGSGQAVYLHMEDTGEVKFDQDTWQEYLLCKECEARFEKYETYVSELLYYPKARALRHINTKNKRILRGIQPEIFKLFQLSVLWRASISSLAIFNKIILSPDEQEFLRKVLHGESAWLYEQYWCDLITYYDREKLLKESTHLIIQPTFEIQQGKVYYLFVFGGYVWAFYMSHSHPQSAKIRNLRENGKYIVPKYDLFKITVIHETVKQAAKMGLFNTTKIERKVKNRYVL